MRCHPFTYSDHISQEIPTTSRHAKVLPSWSTFPGSQRSVGVPLSWPIDSYLFHPWTTMFTLAALSLDIPLSTIKSRAYMLAQACTHIQHHVSFSSDQLYSVPVLSQIKIHASASQFWPTDHLLLWVKSEHWDLPSPFNFNAIKFCISSIKIFGMFWLHSDSWNPKSKTLSFSAIQL